MKGKQIIAAAIVFAATGSAFADAGYTPPAEGFIPAKSRATVMAELKEAKAQGLMSYRDGDYPVEAPTAVAPLTRDEVRAEEVHWAKAHPHRQAGVNDIYFG